MAFTVRTDDELERALDALTAAEHVSRQEVVRRAVLERYIRTEHGARVGHSADRMLVRWHDVIERLADG